MKIKFENGSVLESIESYDCKRSKRAIIYYYKYINRIFLWSKTALVSKDMDRV